MRRNDRFLQLNDEYDLTAESRQLGGYDARLETIALLILFKVPCSFFFGKFLIIYLIFHGLF